MRTADTYTSISEFWKCQKCGETNMSKPHPQEAVVKEYLECEVCGEMHVYKKPKGRSEGYVKKKRFRLPFLP